MKNIIIAATALALSTFAAPAVAAGDAALTGQLLNTNGVPLARASVLVKNSTTNLSTLSDSQGSFDYANLAPGDYDMVVVADRYQAVFYHLTIAQGERVALIMRTTPLRATEVPASVAAEDGLNSPDTSAQSWTQIVSTAGAPKAPALVSVSEVDTRE